MLIPAGHTDDLPMRFKPVEQVQLSHADQTIKPEVAAVISEKDAVLSLKR
jgi:hypothetical protein